MCILTQHLVGLGGKVDAVQKQAKADVFSKMKILNEHLQTRTYMLGDFLSIADIGLVCACLNLFVHVTVIITIGFK